MEKANMNAMPYEKLVVRVWTIKSLYCDYQKCGNEYSSDAWTVIKNMIDEIVITMCDNDLNILRWINGKPCTFVHPITHNRFEMMIGNDCEAIARFLEYCCKLKTGRFPDEGEPEYLAYVIARSNAKWEGR